MRLYHKHLHEYASVIRKVGDSYLVQYDGSEQIWSAPASYFDIVEDELEDA